MNFEKALNDEQRNKIASCYCCEYSIGQNGRYCHRFKSPAPVSFAKIFNT